MFVKRRCSTFFVIAVSVFLIQIIPQGLSQVEPGTEECREQLEEDDSGAVGNTQEEGISGDGSGSVGGSVSGGLTGTDGTSVGISAGGSGSSGTNGGDSETAQGSSQGSGGASISSSDSSNTGGASEISSPEDTTSTGSSGSSYEDASGIGDVQDTETSASSDEDDSGSDEESSEGSNSGGSSNTGSSGVSGVSGDASGSTNGQNAGSSGGTIGGTIEGSLGGSVSDDGSTDDSGSTSGRSEDSSESGGSTRPPEGGSGIWDILTGKAGSNTLGDHSVNVSINGNFGDIIQHIIEGISGKGNSNVSFGGDGNSDGGIWGILTGNTDGSTTGKDAINDNDGSKSTNGDFGDIIGHILGTLTGNTDGSTTGEDAIDDNDGSKSTNGDFGDIIGHILGTLTGNTDGSTTGKDAINDNDGSKSTNGDFGDIIGHILGTLTGNTDGSTTGEDANGDNDGSESTNGDFGDIIGNIIGSISGTESGDVSSREDENSAGNNWEILNGNINADATGDSAVIDNNTSSFTVRDIVIIIAKIIRSFVGSNASRSRIEELKQIFLSIMEGLNDGSINFNGALGISGNLTGGILSEVNSIQHLITILQKYNILTFLEGISRYLGRWQVSIDSTTYGILNLITMPQKQLYKVIRYVIFQILNVIESFVRFIMGDNNLIDMIFGFGNTTIGCVVSSSIDLPATVGGNLAGCITSRVNEVIQLIADAVIEIRSSLMLVKHIVDTTTGCPGFFCLGAATASTVSRGIKLIANIVGTMAHVAGFAGTLPVQLPGCFVGSVTMTPAEEIVKMAGRFGTCMIS